MVLNILIAVTLQVILFYINNKINYSYEQKKLPLIGSLVLALIVSIRFIKEPLGMFESNPYAILITLLGVFLLNITLIDLKYLEIPDTYNFIVFLLGLANAYYFKNKYFLVIAAFSFVLFLIISIISGGALGFGDVKLSIGIGLFFNFPKYLRFLIFTYGIGALVALFLMILKVKGKKDKIAFGPFMAIGAILSILF